MSLTDRMAVWVEANVTDSEGIGEIQFRRSDSDRPKQSAHLVLSDPAQFGEMIVWDSGEVELSLGSPRYLHDEHHEVDDPAELDALLERLVGEFE